DAKINSYEIIPNKNLNSNLTLNCRNSGTLARFLLGFASTRSLNLEIIGDDSLSKRPMLRVAKPIINIGAVVKLNENNYMPAIIKSRSDYSNINIMLSVPSAQLNTTLIFAGLNISGEHNITELI